MDEPTINTIDSPGEYDALVKLRPGEPYFALVGHDMLAPSVVQIWADQTRRQSMARFDRGEIDEAKLKDKLRQCSQAEEIAWAMDEFRKGKEFYTVDVEVEETRRALYTNRSAEQIARDEEIKARAGASKALHEAIGQIAIAVELMTPYGNPIGLSMPGLRAAILHMDGIIKPERPALDAAQDAGIDLSDIPEEGEDWFKRATLREPQA